MTIEQALDIASLESKAFWKPVTENIIFVISGPAAEAEGLRRTGGTDVLFVEHRAGAGPDGNRHRTAAIAGLEALQQLNSQNAIIIRDTPDKLAIAEKMIKDIDKAKPEVVIQVQVLEARLDKMRNLGILPGQTASIGIVPPGTTTTTTGTYDDLDEHHDKHPDAAKPGTPEWFGLQRHAAELYGERTAKRFRHQDHSESRGAIGGRAACEVAYR